MKVTKIMVDIGIVILILRLVLYVAALVSIHHKSIILGLSVIEITLLTASINRRINAKKDDFENDFDE